LDQHERQHGPVRFEFDLEAVPPVRGSAVELTQLLVNIVSNAIDAMTAGGVITIRLFQQSGEIVLTVADTGPGIPREIIDRCFEPYVTSKPTGSGLGLSVCFGIVRRHHGVISARNTRPAGGAEFTIRLPVNRSGVPAADATSPRLRDRPTMLVIDEDLAHLASAAGQLTEYGYDVTTAGSGDAGLQLAHLREFDAIIVDTAMARTSGIGLALTLQRTRPRQLVILSSWGAVSGEDLPEALRRHPRLSKPFSAGEIAAAVSSARD
jgi:CheY-like chemotaxis protein